MKLVFANEAQDDYLCWQEQYRRRVERINTLIHETEREPFTGIGNPEPLKHALAGVCSRRINGEHRMVCKIKAGALLLAQLRFHS